MSASINKVFLLARVGRDPELRDVGDNKVCNFSVATSEKWKNKQGEMQEKTEWSRIVAWGKTAEICKEYLHKGDLVWIEGKLQTREWEKDGVKRQSTEIVANSVQFLGGKGEKKEEPAPPPESEECPF